jgi:hypothetical protein
MSALDLNSFTAADFTIVRRGLGFWKSPCPMPHSQLKQITCMRKSYIKFSIVLNLLLIQQHCKFYRYVDILKLHLLQLGETLQLPYEFPKIIKPNLSIFNKQDVLLLASKLMQLEPAL